MTMLAEKIGGIVLGTEVNGIAVIRSLGRLGVRVGAVTMTTRGDHAHQSRYLSSIRILDRDATDGQIADSLADIARELALTTTVAIPTTDRFAEFLSRNKSTFDSSVIACSPDSKLCDAFLDKWKTAQICEQNEICIPLTVCPATEVGLVKAADEFAYPVIVKPRYTYGSQFPGKNAVFEDRDSLVRFLSNSPLLGQCVIQQIIPSGDGDILVVASYSSADGKVRALYSGRKIRQLLPDYGATCFGLSERQVALECSSRRFLENIGYQGFAALEFARSRSDGRIYFIELNTRTYYHNQLFSDAGIDLTKVAFLDATGQDVKALLGELDQKEGIFWLDFRRDFQSMRLKRVKHQITIWSWFRSIVKARSFAYWDWRDPVPFAAGCAWRWVDIAANVFRRIARRDANTRSSTTRRAA